MGVKLLCTGDVHLGRRPSRLPEQLDPAAMGPAAVWKATVDQAIERGVDAVMLTGDIVDKDNKFYEAYAVLARGVRRLVEADIAVYAVAGNHDFDVFRRLAAEIDGFRFLGEAGQWEESRLERNGQTVLQIVGWSFPARHVSASPLAGLDLTQHGIPTVALLHCDCDGPPASRYAPVRRAELAAVPVDAWLLGHIHAPQIVSQADPLILYPGSPQGLDPGETGPHGPWLIEIEPGSAPAAAPLPLARLRWEHFDVPLDDLTEPEAFGQAIAQALKARHEQIAGDLGPVRAVGCRLTLTGRTPIYRELDPLITELTETGFTVPQDDVDYFIDKITNAARPDIALADRAATGDPAGLLAKRLALLDGGEPNADYRALLARARASIASSDAWRAFASVAPGQPTDISDAELGETLMASGLAALDRLLDQEAAGQ